MSRLALVIVLSATFTATLGCSKSEFACEPAVASLIDSARVCLLPPAQIPGVNVCRNDNATTDAGAVATCVVHASGRYVAQLPPGYRTVFTLHDIEGHEHEEIARMLGCSVGTSKSQLHKARMKLRALLRQQKASE